MRNIFLSFLLIVIMSGGLLAQKTIKDANAQIRNVTGFHAIQVSGGIDLYLTQSNDEAVAVSASKTEYRDKIKTEVQNGVLKIWFENQRNLKVDWGNKKMKAYVSVKNIDGLEGSGGSDIFIDGTLKSSSLKLDISGGSDFNGKVDIADLQTQLSGGSDIDITGKAGKLKIDASGGSDFQGYGLAADVCNIEASGGSDVYITVNKELTAEASGGSDVKYKGEAVLKQIKTHGADIKKTGK
jgi:hypothetical protein